MTTQEAKSALVELRPMGWVEYIIEAIDISIEALEKQIKYRWHYLENNPDDLPEDMKMVEVRAKILCGWDESYHIFTLQMKYNSKIMYGKRVGWGHGYPYNFNVETDEVIAWREIEPF